MTDQLNSIESLLDRFASITATEGPGVTRLSYTPLERAAHDLFADHMSSLGLRVVTDCVGNTIAELAPNRPGGAGEAAVGTGSHLDSVPEGGRFDGVAGVVAGMEVARWASESERIRTRPWRFVAFAAEEGARFGQACNGSRLVAGLTTSADLHQLSDADGVSLASAMTACGLSPDLADRAVWAAAEWSAFIELHIEQGSVLESAGVPIGIVEAISGSTRLQIGVTGVASHTGGSPMHDRRDALAGAAECILACERVATDFEHHRTRITVGRLTVHPNAITTIPGEVQFAVDVRDVDATRQRSTADALIDRFEAITRRRGLGLRAELLADTAPVFLPARVRDVVSAAARDSGHPYRVLVSGASHDSQQINHIVPTGMIFVPSRRGLSHTPEEFTPTHQIRTGTEVLLESLYRLDAVRDN